MIYIHDDKAKQNNTIVSGIPPTLEKWGRPWYFLCKNEKKKIKKKKKKFKFFFFYFIFFKYFFNVNCCFCTHKMYIVVTHEMYLT